MLIFLKTDLKKTKALIITEGENFEKLTAKRDQREAIKKAKMEATAKEKEFTDADTWQKKLREGKKKAENELKNLKAQLTTLEKSGTSEQK